ncbi:hypothetical protein Cfor_01076, partial [Coptotermes formosanus]
LLIPSATCEFRMGSSEKGLLNAISYMGMISSSHLWGFLADTRGRRKTLIVSLILDAICGLLSSVAHSYWLFLALRFFNGFFVCAASAVVFAYLGEFHSGRTRSRAVMHMSVFLSVGGIYQQALAWLIIPQDWALYLPWLPLMFGTWRMFVILNAIPSIVAVAFLFILPESPKFLFTISKEEEAVEVLRRMFTLNTGQSAKEYPVERIVMDKEEIGSVAVVRQTSMLEIVKSMWLQTKPLFQRPHLFLTILACLIQFGLYASFNGLALWLPDVYNRLARYWELNPNHTLTICEVIAALTNSSVASDTSRHSTEIEIQIYTEINNLTYSELMKANNTVNISSSPVLNYSKDSARYDVARYIGNNTALVDMIAAINGTWLHSNTTATPTCSSSVNPAVFRNSLAIGVVCGIVYTSAVYVGNKRNAYLPTSKTKCCVLSVAFILTSSVSGAFLLLANSELLVVTLSAVFIAMAGVCVNMLNTIVIDNIPTRLRAMAVCLSLMSGRIGVTLCSLVLGVMLDYACTAAICLLSGTVL